MGRFGAAALAVLLVLAGLGGATAATAETTSNTVNKLAIVEFEEVRYTTYFDEEFGGYAEIQTDVGTIVMDDHGDTGTTVHTMLTSSAAHDYNDATEATLVIKADNGTVLHQTDVTESFTSIHSVPEGTTMETNFIDIDESFGDSTSDPEDSDTSAPSGGGWPIQWSDDDYSEPGDIVAFVGDSIRAFVSFLVGVPIWIVQSGFAGAQALVDGLVSWVVGLSSSLASAPAEALDAAFDSAQDQLPGGVPMYIAGLSLMLLTFAGYQVGVSRLG